MLVEQKETQIEVIMSKEEAKGLTEAIKSTSNALYILLKKAHDEQAHVALGYGTWGEYVKTEFNFSRQRSYQLINQAAVIEHITDETGIEDLYISEKDARAIKNKLPEITEKVKEETKDLEGEQAKDKAQEILRNEAHLLEDEEEVREPKRKELVDDYEEPEVGGPGGMPVVTAPEGERDYSKYSGDPVEKLLGVFDVFAVMPDPQDVAKKIKKGQHQQIIDGINTTYTFLVKLLEEMN